MWNEVQNHCKFFNANDGIFHFSKPLIVPQDAKQVLKNFRCNTGQFVYGQRFFNYLKQVQRRMRPFLPRHFTFSPPLADELVKLHNGILFGKYRILHPNSLNEKEDLQWTWFLILKIKWIAFCRRLKFWDSINFSLSMLGRPKVLRQFPNVIRSSNSSFPSSFDEVI